MPYAVEQIPDPELLFRRAHKTFFRRGTWTLGIFKLGEDGGMSTNWSRYATAQSSRENLAQPAGNYAIFAATAGSVRAIQDLRVEHTPKDYNQAHADVFGNVEDGEIRVLLSRAFSINSPVLSPTP